MSRRIAPFVTALALVSTLAVPAVSQAQAAAGVREIAIESSWLSGLWNQLIDRLAPIGDALGLGGRRLASQTGIEPIAPKSEAGIQIDADGRTAPASN